MKTTYRKLLFCTVIGVITYGINIFGQTAADLTRFTSAPGMEYHPQWKPDGGGIMYTASKGKGPIVEYKSLADDKAIVIPTLLTGDKHISWSGDGERFVYDTRSESPPHIVMGSIDEDDHEAITGQPCGHPNWSKGSDYIAYITIGENFQDHVFIYDIKNKTHRQLTNSGGNKMHPNWSKDGSRLIYSNDITGSFQIWMVDLQGNETRITHSDALDDWADWSWDGTRITFASNRSGNREIWIKNLSTGDLQQLTENPAIDNHPNWSPDDKKIAFTSDRSGNLDIWVMTL